MAVRYGTAVLDLTQSQPQVEWPPYNSRVTFLDTESSFVFVT